MPSHCLQWTHPLFHIFCYQGALYTTLTATSRPWSIAQWITNRWLHLWLKRLLIADSYFLQVTSNLLPGLHLTSHFGTWSQGLETDEIILSNIKRKVVVNQLGLWQQENNSFFMLYWQLFHLVTTLRILTMSLSDPLKSFISLFIY